MNFDELIDPRRPYADEIATMKTLNEFQDAQVLREQMSFRIRELMFDFSVMRRDKDTPDRERIAAFLDHLDALSSGVPTTDELEKAPVLDRWCAIHDTDTVILIGYVTRHPYIRDQGRSRTSLVLQIQPENGWARTWNRFYRLGSPSRLTFFEWQYDGKISPRMQIVEFE
jgi:hypothetical protein